MKGYVDKTWPTWQVSASNFLESKFPLQQWTNCPQYLSKHDIVLELDIIIRSMIGFRPNCMSWSSSYFLHVLIIDSWPQNGVEFRYLMSKDNILSVRMAKLATMKASARELNLCMSRTIRVCRSILTILCYRINSAIKLNIWKVNFWLGSKSKQMETAVSREKFIFKYGNWWSH